MATSADFEPFEFIQDGKMVGIDIDLVEALKKETGLQIDIVEAPFDTLFEKLEKSEFDGIIAGVNITSERKTKFDFTQEYSSLEGGVAIALKKDSPYLSVFNSAISKLKANGTLQYIEAKYSK